MAGELPAAVLSTDVTIRLVPSGATDEMRRSQWSTDMPAFYNPQSMRRVWQTITYTEVATRPTAVKCFPGSGKRLDAEVTYEPDGAEALLVRLSVAADGGVELACDACMPPAEGEAEGGGARQPLGSVRV